MRRDLAASSSDLRAQVSPSVREFETLRTSLLQTLHETVIACDTATRRQVEHIDAIAKGAAEQIANAFDGNRREAERMAILIENVGRTVDEASRRVAKIELPTDRLSEQLAAFATDLEALCSVLAR